MINSKNSEKLQKNKEFYRLFKNFRKDPTEKNKELLIFAMQEFYIEEIMRLKIVKRSWHALKTSEEDISQIAIVIAIESINAYIPPINNMEHFISYIALTLQRNTAKYQTKEMGYISAYKKGQIRNTKNKKSINNNQSTTIINEFNNMWALLSPVSVSDQKKEELLYGLGKLKPTESIVDTLHKNKNYELVSLFFNQLPDHLLAIYEQRLFKKNSVATFIKEQNITEKKYKCLQAEFRKQMKRFKKEYEEVYLIE